MNSQTGTSISTLGSSYVLSFFVCFGFFFFFLVVHSLAQFHLLRLTREVASCDLQVCSSSTMPEKINYVH